MIRIFLIYLASFLSIANNSFSESFSDGFKFLNPDIIINRPIDSDIFSSISISYKDLRVSENEKHELEFFIKEQISIKEKSLGEFLEDHLGYIEIYGGVNSPITISIKWIAQEDEEMEVLKAIYSLDNKDLIIAGNKSNTISHILNNSPRIVTTFLYNSNEKIPLRIFRNPPIDISKISENINNKSNLILKIPIMKRVYLRDLINEIFGDKDSILFSELQNKGIDVKIISSEDSDYLSFYISYDEIYDGEIVWKTLEDILFRLTDSDFRRVVIQSRLDKELYLNNSRFISRLFLSENNIERTLSDISGVEDFIENIHLDLGVLMRNIQVFSKSKKTNKTFNRILSFNKSPSLEEFDSKIDLKLDKTFLEASKERFLVKKYSNSKYQNIIISEFDSENINDTRLILKPSLVLKKAIDINAYVKVVKHIISSDSFRDIRLLYKFLGADVKVENFNNNIAIRIKSPQIDHFLLIEKIVEFFEVARSINRYDDLVRIFNSLDLSKDRDFVNTNIIKAIKDTISCFNIETITFSTSSNIEKFEEINSRIAKYNSLTMPSSFDAAIQSYGKGVFAMFKDQNIGRVQSILSLEILKYFTRSIDSSLIDESSFISEFNNEYSFKISESSSYINNFSLLKYISYKFNSKFGYTGLSLSDKKYSSIKKVLESQLFNRDILLEEIIKDKRIIKPEFIILQQFDLYLK